MHLRSETRLFMVEEEMISVHDWCQRKNGKREREANKCFDADVYPFQDTHVKRRRITKKKSVHFFNQTVCIRRKMFTTDLPSTWYNHKDYAVFRENMRADILAYRNAKDVHSVVQSNEFCVRGLEKYCFPEEHGLSKKKKRQRIDTVLDQQLFQRAIGGHDPQTLGLVAEILAERSCKHALDMAAMDALNCQ